VLTIRLVGVMLLMSMLSLPIMTAEIFCRRFKSIMLGSIIVSIVTGVAGLMIAASVDVPCSAIIVLLMAAAFVICKVIAELRHRE
jgi:zinc transport system permease protein